MYMGMQERRQGGGMRGIAPPPPLKQISDQKYPSPKMKNEEKSWKYAFS